MSAPTTPSMSQFTCLSCRVVFKTSEAQKAHHRSDWHRYNLQRKAVQLPCVSLEVFRQREETMRKMQASEADEPSGGTCQVCKCVAP